MSSKGRGRRRHYRSNGRFGPPHLSRISDERLLDMRIRDLGVQIQGTPLEDRVERLYYELDSKGIRFRPHVWLSDDWFTADGNPGIAIPFYLAHPRLMRLEGKQMLEVEGGTEEWCMKILRHEVGHAIDNAYRLHHRRRWREVFGKASQPYPEYYEPRPYSKSFVRHLEAWYAQSHPVEDFAETFAVWLKPRSRWRSQYQGWPALKKLEYVDELMSMIRIEKPKVTTRRRVDPVSRITKKLREHYKDRRAHYGLDHLHFYDRELQQLFPNGVPQTRRPTAAAFLRRVRPRLRKAVSQWTGEYQYTIDQILSQMIERCQELKLRIDRPEEEVERDALVMLTVQIMNYLHEGRHRVAL